MYNFSKIEAEINQKLPSILLTKAHEFEYDLYAVGGCIRDAMLGDPHGDIDLAVVGDAAKLAKTVSNEIKDAKLAIYARFGTALLKLPGSSIELATARKESYLPDSRKPVNIEPVTIEEDLKRRDFTVNAIALGLTGADCGRSIDLFDGVSDLKDRLIRTPLDPMVTFSDDPLRMLRAIRFAARFGFKIETSTWQGIIDNRNRLEIVAGERISDEIKKMISGSDPVRAMQMLISTGLMNLIIPEVSAMSGVEQIGKHHHKDVLNHSLKVMQNVVDCSDDPTLRLAALLHDVGKPNTKRFDVTNGWTFHGHESVGARMTHRIGRRLNFGKTDLNKLVDLVRLHMRPVNLTSEGVTDSAIRRLMVDTGDNLEDQLVLCRADITTANPNLVDKYLGNFSYMEKRMKNVLTKDELRKFQSPVRGEEIIELCKVEPGPIVGALKERVEDAILDGIIPFEYEAAKEYLLKMRDEVIKLDDATMRKERKNRAHNRNSVDSAFDIPKAKNLNSK